MIFKILILKMVFKTFLLNCKNNITITNEFGGNMNTVHFGQSLPLPNDSGPTCTRVQKA